MATIILFGFSLLLCAGVALPVARDLNSTQSLDSDTIDTVVIKRTIKHDAVTVLSLEDNSVRDKVLVQRKDSGAVVTPSLSDGVKSLRRNKRAAITGNGCSIGTRWIANQCVTLKKYKELRENEEDK